MRMATASALTVALIAGIALSIGLPRAIQAFGAAGLTAYAKLPAAPALMLAVLFLRSPFPADRRPSLFFPRRQFVKTIAWLVALATTIFLLAGAIYGVEWLVRR